MKRKTLPGKAFQNIFGLLLLAGPLLFLAACQDKTAATPLVPLVPAKSTLQASGQYQKGECQFDEQYGPPGQEAGNVECGSLAVPADRQQASSPKLNLNVTIFKSTAAEPAADPVFILASPGNDGGQFFFLGRMLQERLKNRAFIFMDLRGSNQEPSLGCSEVREF